MSDLVERVARAMVTSRDGWPDADAGGCKVWQMYETEARAAIKAVAEWLAQAEDRECNPLQALANELKEGSE